MNWNDQVLAYLKNLADGIISSLVVATGIIKAASASTANADTAGTDLVLKSGASTGTGGSNIYLYTASPNTTTDGYIIQVGGAPTAGGTGYLDGDILSVDEGTGGTVRVLTTDVLSSVATIDATPTAAGSGYSVDDVLTLDDGDSLATVKVDTIGALGIVTGVSILTGGSGYSTGAGLATTYAGAGIGCTVEILTVGVGEVLTIELASPGSSGYTVGNGKATTGDNGAGCTIAIADIANSTAVDPTLKAQITGEGNFVVGAAGAVATTATDGFLHIPICAGAPTGVPTTYSGKAAIVYDATNNRLYAYDGAWTAIYH